MSLLENPDSVKLIQQLLYPNKDETSDSSDDEVDNNKLVRNLGPGDMVSKKSVYNAKKEEKLINVKSNEEKTPLAVVDNEDKNEIEKWLEKQEKEDNEILETRKRPEYSITYKQAIGTEDLYLQMSNRTSGSMSCEDIIIEIQMPDETVDVEQMDLSVTELNIDLKSPVYRLKLPLMQPIDPDKGHAKYDNDRKILILTLRMRRELDFVNF